MSDPIRPSKDEIERCAFLIYIAEGCPEDRALDHWLEAESQLIAAARHDAGAMDDLSTVLVGER